MGYEPLKVKRYSVRMTRMERGWDLGVSGVVAPRKVGTVGGQTDQFQPYVCPYDRRTFQ